jgi:hypothetical protein
LREAKAEKYTFVVHEEGVEVKEGDVLNLR